MFDNACSPKQVPDLKQHNESVSLNSDNKMVVGDEPQRCGPTYNQGTGYY